jgi:hypothetical protein
MPQARWFGLVFCLAFTGACSSGSGTAPTSTTGSGNFSCSSFCNQMSAHQCPNDNLSDCATQCQSSMGKYGACGDQLGSATQCLLDHVGITCDSSGHAQLSVDSSSYLTVLEQSCPNEFQAFALCSACQVQADDSPSTQCAKTQCCSQMKALISDPQTLGLAACIEQCGSGTQCISGCESQYPGLTGEAEAVAQCETQNCP